MCLHLAGPISVLFDALFVMHNVVLYCNACKTNDMTVERFHSLSMPQQHYYTMKCAVYLAARHSKEFSSYLFQHPEFYIELYYEHGQIECSLVRGFTSAQLLQPYLEEISIEALFEG